MSVVSVYMWNFINKTMQVDDILAILCTLFIIQKFYDR